MATRSKARCTSCGRFKGSSDPRNVKEIEKFLKKKSKEAKMKKKDRLTGSRSYTKYVRKQGKPRSRSQCCAGKGHRGRVKKKKCCEIL